jgi:GH35 family endo-1,4-beta-xylanase
LTSTVGKGYTTLREAAQGSGVDVGVALGLGHLTQDSAYADLAAREYNLVTAENECKTNSIVRGWETQDFTACESIYSFT